VYLFAELLVGTFFSRIGHPQDSASTVRNYTIVIRPACPVNLFVV
jgi:hypothetical protein